MREKVLFARGLSYPPQVEFFFKPACLPKFAPINICQLKILKDSMSPVALELLMHMLSSFVSFLSLLFLAG